MVAQYNTLSDVATAEIVEKKSRFIADAAPVQTEKEALDFIASIKARYPDARHHVYAYTVREEDTQFIRYSDDGEPQGTGGLPVLDVLRKKALENVVVVVTRYFGGILLGAPGLTRAYSGSCAEVISKAGIAQICACQEVTVTVSYSDTGRVQNLLNSLCERFRMKVETSSFTHEVSFILHVHTEDVERVTHAIIDGTDARAVLHTEKQVFYRPL